MPPDDPAASSSSGAPLPEGPRCSVQVVTHAELTDPLPKGEEAGVFPTVVGDTLEDFCGCHTLMSNGQNVEHAGLKPPGNSLWLDYADLERPVGGGTLGQAMADEVMNYGMPPGSCSYPGSAADVLEAWFAQGMPDGANFTEM